MLEVSNLQAAYGASQVLFGVDLSVARGEVVTLLGRNGMGKTTTLNAIMGLVATTAGRITFDGDDIRGLPPYRIARRGIGLVPEGRQVFPNLSVRENLVATAGRSDGAEHWTVEQIYNLFPALAERSGCLAGVLSGGEQQMLAIGRALMTNPKLLILDEATEGLAPLVRDDIWRVLREIKDAGIATILVDKHIRPLLSLADRHHILVKGRVVFAGSGAELVSDPARLRSYLGV